MFDPHRSGCPQGKILSPRGSMWIKKGVFSPCYERHEYACTRMIAYLFKRFFGKKILHLCDQCPSKFNTLGCGHSLFPLRDSRGKRTREPAPLVLKRDANLVPRAFAIFFSWLKKGKSPGNEVDVTRVWSPCENRRPPQAIFTCTRVLFWLD